MTSKRLRLRRDDGGAGLRPAADDVLLQGVDNAAFLSAQSASGSATTTSLLVVAASLVLAASSAAGSATTEEAGVGTAFRLSPAAATASASTQPASVVVVQQIVGQSAAGSAETLEAILERDRPLAASAAAGYASTAEAAMRGASTLGPATLGGYEHTFTYGNSSRSNLSGGSLAFPVADFRAELDVSGGFLSAAASLPDSETSANPGVYRMGAKWTVRDIDTREIVFAGTLKDPSGSGGVTQLSADGWGQMQEQKVGRFQALSYNLDSWVGFDSPDFDLDAVASSGDSGMNLLQPGGAAGGGMSIGNSLINAERKGAVLAWSVGTAVSGVAFRDLDPGAKYDKATDAWTGQKTQWANGFMVWVPDAKPRHIAFRVVATRKSDKYALDLVGVKLTRDASGNLALSATFGVPQGPMTMIKSWKLSELGETSAADLSWDIDGTYDIVGLRLRRLVPSVKTAQPLQVRAYKVRMGSVLTSASAADAMTLSTAFSSLLTTMGAGQKVVANSSVVAVPFDQTGTYGQIADALGLVDNWFWRIDADGSGAPVGRAGPVEEGTVWDVTDPHAPVDLTPEVRYNRVRYNFNYGNGQEGYDYVVASGYSVGGSGTGWPLADYVTYDLQVQQPAPRAWMQRFAQQVADYLALPRQSGRVTAVEVTGGGGVTRASSVKPGDRLRLTRYGNVTLVVSRMTILADGTVDFELATGSPMLQRWLSRRDRFLAMGLDGLGAMMGLLGASPPAVPTNVTLAFDPIEETQKLDYDAVVTWTPVLTDTSSPPMQTAIDSYIVRIHPTDLTGKPLEGDNKGWRERTVLTPSDDDMRAFLAENQHNINTPIGTQARFPRIPKPKKWKWVAQVRAVDVIGQLSDWSPLTAATLPTQYGPKPVAASSIELDTDSQKITLSWDPPEAADKRDPTGGGDDEDSYLSRLAPQIAHYNVRLYHATSKTGTGKTIQGKEMIEPSPQHTWQVGSNWKDFWWNGWVQTVDLFGNVSAWAKSGWKKGTPPRPDAPTNVTLKLRLREDDGRARYAAHVQWDVVDNIPVNAYVVQLRAIDASGNAVTGEGSAATQSKTVAAPANSVQVSDVAVSGTGAASIVTYTTTEAHGFETGDKVKAKGFAASFNGTFTVSGVTPTTVKRSDYTATPSGSDDTGTLTEVDADGKVGWVSSALPRPNSWTWKARVRARAASGGLGPWSDWVSSTGGSSKVVAVSAVSIASGLMTYAVASGHGIGAGDSVTASGFAPSDVNGSFVVQSVTATTVVRAYSGATTTVTDGVGELSVAKRERPPAPSGITLKFVRPSGRGRYRARVTFGEVVWSPADGDVEPMDSYGVELQVAKQYGPGGTKANTTVPDTAWARLNLIWAPARDEDADTVKTVKFPNPCKRIHRYRVRVRSKGTSGRTGPWSGYTGSAGTA